MRRKDPEKMKELIDFIDGFYVAYHRTPSTREIAEGTSLQKSAVHNYLLFRTLYAAKTGRNRQIKCTSHLMENDEKHVRIHEVFS